MNGQEKVNAIRAVVYGKVQGVGFRDTAQLLGRGLGLMGWVANAEDGSVVVHAEGPEREVGELVAFLHEGTPSARVTHVEVESVPVEHHEQFAIRGISSGAFVIQEHLASSRHFDLRLELDGVMCSWAVPQGPSMDPAAERLAIEVADHTMADGEFEGSAERHSVIIWDRGFYERGGRIAWPAALDLGDVVFTLRGEKLRGEFALRRNSKGIKPHWSLTKRDDEHARPGSDVVAESPRSVISGRKLEDILRGV